MSLNISREIEARLVSEAQRQGLSIDALLDRFMNGREPAKSGNGERRAIELPLWHLGGGGPFHRRDLYDDAG